MDTAEQTHPTVETLSSLPPLPATAQQIIDAFGDEFIDADDVTRIVSEDPGIAAKLLGLANSAYYGLAEPVDRLEDAVGRVIGVETVRSVVLAMAMQKTLNRESCPAFDTERFWRESLITAQCCKRVALRDPRLDEHGKRLAYVAGLCHNIGLMALAFLKPSQTNRVLSENTDRHVRFDADLEKTTGVSHREATVILSERWGLPTRLVEAFRCRFDASQLVNCRLGMILVAATSAVGNLDIEEDHRFDLDSLSHQLGIAVDDLQAMALPGQRQREQIEALASSMAI